MKTKSTLRLPPDRESHDLKVQRVNYQTFIFLNFAQAESPPSPLNNGWILEEGFCVPVRHHLPALPRYLKEVVQQQENEADNSSSDSAQSDSGSDNDDVDGNDD